MMRLSTDKIYELRQRHRERISRVSRRGVRGSLVVFKGISEQKAMGLGAVAGGLMWSAFSPLFWTLALLLFALFFVASRLGNKILRVFLFWIPTLTVSVLVMAIVALFAYASIHFSDR